MKKRPWIWFIVANVMYFAGIGVLVTVAIRHKLQEVPVAHGR